MIVSCAGCGTKYKVSDDKVGPLGVKVRCPKCRTVFEVRPPKEERPESLAEKLFGKDVVVGGPSEPAPAPSAPRPPERPALKVAAEPPVQAEARGSEPQAVRQPEQPDLGQQPEAEQPAVGKEAAGAAVTPGEGSEAGRKAPFPFKDAGEDPRILARALVSDILFYNRDSRDRGLAEGKTLAYLGREIARSWDTYKERVGLETAMETGFFRQAVNEILGEGKAIL